jgi:hypothetical protein
MTERVKGLLVVFESDIREDDAQHIINAISLLRGVAAVKTEISDATDLINRERIKLELRMKLFEVLK